MQSIAEDPSHAAWQEALDTFYMSRGPCCAGCDYWLSLSPQIGECTQTPPKFSSAERLAMIGIEACTLRPGAAGHALTKREHVCGAFKDEFDWTVLPLPYRARIGDRSLKRSGA